MSSQVTIPCEDADETSGPSRPSNGMFDWMKRIAKPPVAISKSCVVFPKLQSNQMSPNIMKEKPSTMINEPNKIVDTFKKNGDSCSSHDLGVSDDEVNQVNLSLGEEVGGPSSSMRCDEKLGVQETSKEQGLTCLPADQVSGQVVAIEKQFSSDNFACIDKGKCKYKKFSALLLLEKKTNNNTSHELQSMTKNFYPFFRNVKTMRICTMVDSSETKSRLGQRVSQRAHQFQFTKETCVNLSRDDQMCGERRLTAHVKEKTVGEFVRTSPFIRDSNSHGVRIEPLQSDNAGIEMVGSPLSCELDARNESYVQHDTAQIDDVRNRIVASGSKSMASSPVKEDHATDETVGPRTEKARSKRPINEIPDINEEIPTLQPEGSSTDSKEVSTSRVHSLNAKHLFPIDEQPLKPEFRPVQDSSPVNDYYNSRWIKRLRVSSSNEYYVGTMSSDIEEPSPHKKYGEFLNNITNTSTIPTVDVTDQHSDSPKNSECALNSPKDGVYNVVNSCPWIQRWRKDPNFGSNPQVLCEPHSLQLGVDEVGKRQFPSIGAMALMGKTMNGLRSCEIKKKGSVFVWNTKEY